MSFKKAKKLYENNTFDITVKQGDIITLTPLNQKLYKHGIKQSTKDTGARISISFRQYDNKFIDEENSRNS
jgi:alkylated DNA repair dioxygenase AlkB